MDGQQDNTSLLGRLDERTASIQSDIKEIKDSVSTVNRTLEAHDRAIAELQRWRLTIENGIAEYKKTQAERKEDVKRLGLPIVNWAIIAILVAIGNLLGALITHLTIAH